MHIHQSIHSAQSGENIFTDADGRLTTEFFQFGCAGQQRHSALR